MEPPDQRSLERFRCVVVAGWKPNRVPEQSERRQRDVLEAAGRRCGGGTMVRAGAGQSDRHRLVAEWPLYRRHRCELHGRFHHPGVGHIRQGEPQLAVRRPFNAMHGRLSPDARWLAYASDESGAPQVYVQGFPVTSADDWKQLSFEGGVEPRWRGDGRELFFLGTDMRIMSVEIPGGNALAAATAQPLFQARVPLIGHPAHELRGLARRPAVPDQLAVGDGLSSPFSVVLNWPALLTR